MEIRDIGVVSPGDMGQALSVRLAESVFRVHAALDGRGLRTRRLALEARMHDCGSLDALVETRDRVLSVINPAGSVALAEAIRRTGRAVVVADLNAISPAHAREAAGLVEAAGRRLIEFPPATRSVRPAVGSDSWAWNAGVHGRCAQSATVWRRGAAEGLGRQPPIVDAAGNIGRLRIRAVFVALA